MEFKEISVSSLKKYLKITRIEADISHLSESQKSVLAYLIEATKHIQDLYMMQRNAKNVQIIEALREQKKDSLLKIFYIMAGGVNEFDNTVFIKDYVQQDGCGFYPEDLTIEEWNEWLENHPEDEEEFCSPYTVIVRDENGGLAAKKYCDFYREKLVFIADMLYEAGEATENFYLKSFLNAQANAFLTNNFEQADIRWIQLENNSIEPLIGAYEYYDDRFLGYKTSFTSFITIKNEVQLHKMQQILKLVDTLQALLPVPANYKKNKVERKSQLTIVDVIYSAGDGRGPVVTAAFNLPNSQKIRAEFGAKKIIMHNVIKAKFDSIMLLIADVIFGERNKDKISFDAYFNHIILHEISHGLGIGMIKDDDGELRDVSYYLKDLYSVIEEAKADVMALFLLFYLIKQGILTDCNITELIFTYLTGMLRSIRFGHNNPHGIANLIQWNFLLGESAILILQEEPLNITADLRKMELATEKLLTLLLTIQGEGNYEMAESLIEKYGVSSPIISEFVEKMKDLPVDILPYFPLAAETEPFVNEE
jgi:hypothetical protein